MKPLTPRQQRILAFLQAYIKEHGYPPSIRDIMQGCQVSSTAVVDYNLDILARLSYIRRDPGIPRGIVVLRKGDGHPEAEASQRKSEQPVESRPAP